MIGGCRRLLRLATDAATDNAAGATPQPYQLSARHLVKRFKNRAILDDVSITVGRDEIVGLLGPNGAGKTTCFNAIVGLIKPDAGSISMGGEDISTMPIHRRSRQGLAYLPQERSIFPDFTALQNVRAFLEIRQKAPPRQIIARARQLLDDMKIGPLANTRAGVLSGGEQRRVEIARLLAISPQFILMDEPFAAISPIAVKDLKNIIQSLCGRGIGVLITDHNVREALDICHRAYILANGQVLTEGTPADIVRDPQARSVYLGDDYPH